MGVKPTAEDKKWQAEGDADTLACAEEIKSDPARLKAAIKAAEEKAELAKKQAATVKKYRPKSKGYYKNN